VRPWLLAVIQEVCYAPRGSSINIGGPGRDGEWISGSSLPPVPFRLIRLAR